MLPSMFLQVVFIFFYCYSHLVTQSSCHKTNGMFVFGSSLVSNGNNRFVNGFTEVDYLPYGIDFPLGPTGRSCNGKNVIDAIGELLKLPPYLPVSQDPKTKGTKILHGVDFASGGSGILDVTGAGRVISLNQQIRNFKDVTLPDLKLQLGSNLSLSNYLFIVGTGGNDLLYFLQHSSTLNVSLQHFATNLTKTLSKQIKKLHHLGARKFVLISVYPIGCIPLAKGARNAGCVDSLNQVSQVFNTQMKSLGDVLQPKLRGSHFIYVNSYQILIDIIHNPAPKGFNDTSSSCCELPRVNGVELGVVCRKGGSVCKNRRAHVFFDGLHPTEAVNEFIAKKAFNSSLQTEVSPINIQQLAKL